MKFFLELPIKKSRAEVWKAFDNPENTKKWQRGLIKFETIDGLQGQPGAMSKLTYSENGREFFLMERILHRAEPEQFDGVYENEFADNTIKNSFITTSETETLWKMEVVFVFKTLVMKIVGPLMKKNFVLRTKRDMERFKEFVEKM